MLITGYLLLWGIMSFFLPYKMRKLYTTIASFALPVLYFGFNPPNLETYDVGRYYIILEQMRTMGVQEVLGGSLSFYITTFIGDTHFVAQIYFWLISKLGVNELLPYITGVIVYSICFGMLHDASEKYSLTNTQFGIIISYILFFINYGEISGVRNILAFSVAAYVLYLDFATNKNIVFCLMIYTILVFLHTSVMIILALRLVLLVRKIVSFRVIAFCCFVSYSFIGIIKKVLSKFSRFDIINVTLMKIVGYSEREEYNYRLVFGSLVILFLCFLLAYYASKNDKKFFGKYYEFVVCFVAIAFGGIFSDVLISRLSTLAIFISIPCAVFLLHHSLTRRSVLTIKANNKKQLLLGIVSVCFLYFSIFFFAFFHLFFSYIPTFSFF